MKVLSIDAFGTLFRIKGTVGGYYRDQAMLASSNAVQNLPDTATFNRAFSCALKQQQTHLPNFGANTKTSSKDWWKAVVYATFANAKVQLPSTVNFNKDVFEPLYSKFATKEPFELFAALPDVQETLRRCRSVAKIKKIGLVSNSDKRLPQIIASLGLASDFDFVICSEEAKYEKPAKQIFHRIFTQTGYSAFTPDDVVHVGDDLARDYRGAADAGFKALLYASNGSAAGLSANETISDLLDLPNRLLRL